MSSKMSIAPNSSFRTLSSDGIGCFSFLRLVATSSKVLIYAALADLVAKSNCGGSGIRDSMAVSLIWGVSIASMLLFFV